MSPPTFLIVTGLSGAGKTQASHFLEDLGFFRIDNLPPALISTFARLCASTKTPISRVALGIDIRGGEFFADLFHELDELKKAGFSHRILFLDAEDATLVNRYKETRRRHPLSNSEGDLLSCIRTERARLAEVRERADLIINTTNDSVWDLRDELVRLFGKDESGQSPLLIQVVSFGFKYGVPLDADLMFDVRFLKNPNYERELAPLDGRHPKVREFVMSDPTTVEFHRRLCEFLGFLLPQFVTEGKAYLSIAIGCTGGRHRSVCLATVLGEFLTERGYNAQVVHRDLDRPSPSPDSPEEAPAS